MWPRPLALLVYFRRDWIRIIGGMARSVQTRRIDTADARLGWLLVLATLPVGITRTPVRAPPAHTVRQALAAGLFLMINGVILLAGERLRRRRSDGSPSRRRQRRRWRRRRTARATLAELETGGAVASGGPDPGPVRRNQRSGATMTAGLLHGSTTTTPPLLVPPGDAIILAAGIYKLPDLLGPLGDGIRLQMLVGSICAGLASYAAVRFLVRWFHDPHAHAVRRLLPHRRLAGRTAFPLILPAAAVGRAKGDRRRPANGWQKGSTEPERFAHRYGTQTARGTSTQKPKAAPRHPLNRKESVVGRLLPEV